MFFPLAQLLLCKVSFILLGYLWTQAGATKAFALCLQTVASSHLNLRVGLRKIGPPVGF